MHICVIMGESHFALRVNLAFKVHFQAFGLLNVSLWFIHEPHVVCDKVTWSSSEGFQMFGPSDLIVTGFPFKKTQNLKAIRYSAFTLMPDRMALSFKKIDGYSDQNLNWCKVIQ